MGQTLFWAQAAAVSLVFFAGLSVYQLTASHAELEEKALRFADLAAETEGSSLTVVRCFAYGVVPLVFLGLLAMARIPALAILASAVKLMLSAALSLWIENRVLLGEGYSPQRHRMARLDSLANLLMAMALIYSVLYLRRAG